jgi:hypothetical protein
MGSKIDHSAVLFIVGCSTKRRGRRVVWRVGDNLSEVTSNDIFSPHKSLALMRSTAAILQIFGFTAYDRLNKS